MPIAILTVFTKQPYKLKRDAVIILHLFFIQAICLK